MRKHDIPQVPHDPGSVGFPPCCSCRVRSWEIQKEELVGGALDGTLECRFCGAKMRVVIPRRSPFIYFLCFIKEDTRLGRACDSFVRCLFRHEDLGSTMILPHHGSLIVPEKNFFVALRKECAVSASPNKG